MSPASGFSAIPAGGLPIYRLDRAADALFYTPGRLCRVALPDAPRFASELVGRAPPRPAAAAIRGRGEWALRRWLDLRQAPFSPECLTLYLNAGCSLRCTYCYSDAVPSPSARLALDDIRSAAEHVAANCRAQGRPLTVALHGGGEPLLDVGLAERALDLLDEAAGRHGVPLTCYVATNGVLSEEAVAWLARRCQLVGLSCDGPPDIQDRQRPLRDGRPTSAAVERTARLLRAAGTPFHVRVTVTPAGLPHVPDIVAYLCRVLGPQAIHVEPVYQGGRAATGAGFQPPQAGEFVACLLAARAAARDLGVPVFFSGSRLGEVHGSYCHVFRQVVNLVPGGGATACFKLATAAQAEAMGAVIGRPDPATGQFVLDAAGIDALRGRLAVVRARCEGCFNRYHCTRDCPDACPLVNGDESGPTFRCRMQMLWAQALIEQAAAHLDLSGEQVYDLAGV
jgi:uncharacterized protein